MAFRSVTTGLLGACVYLLTDLAIRVQPVDADGVELARITDPSPYARTPTAEPKSAETQATNGVTIIDVAPNVPAATIAGLITLAEGERIVMVGDRMMMGNVSAGAQIAADVIRGERFLDLIISKDGTTRRVIVALH
jgi:hypothetical protein